MSSLTLELFCVSLQVRLKLPGQAVLTLIFLYWDDSSPIQFDLILIFLLTDHLNLAWSISLCLFPNETETVCASSFNLNFGLVYLILFLDEHSLIHLQLIFHFVANFNSAF